MEYAESSKGMLEKMITNETLAKMTRGSHFNPKVGGSSNGFRSPMLPPHLNGKTISSLTQSGSKSNSEQQPRRSVITLKNAPGPPVNSSGTGVLKTKSSATTLERLGSETKAPGGGRGGRSRKRSREGETPASELSTHHEEKKDNGAADQSTSASENVESTRRRRRGQSSKRSDKKNGHLPPVADLSSSKLKVSSNSAGATGILDMYGLKSKPVDISRFMVNIAPLDILLSEDCEETGLLSGEDDGEARLVIEEINNVMQLLPKHTLIQKPFVENALNEDVKVRLMLDLERPSQAEENQQVEDRLHRTGSLEKTKSKSLELFPTFTIEDLPLHSVEEFIDRLKLPVSDSLETLISFSKPTDHAGSGTEKTSRFEGIPPSPFSFSPCGVIDYSRSARTARASGNWSKPENGAKAKLDQATVKTEPAEVPDAVAVKPKIEEASVSHRERVGEVEQKNKSSVHPGLPALQLKRDEEEASHSRKSGLPAMPCSPGVQAATILCTMANSDEKEYFVGKGKRQKSNEHGHHRISKLARIDDKPRNQSPEARREHASHSPSTKKSPVSGEKRKSLSQVNHSLSSVAARGNSHDAAPSRTASTNNHNKPWDDQKEGGGGGSGRQTSSARVSQSVKPRESSSSHSARANGVTASPAPAASSKSPKIGSSSMKKETGSSGLTTVSRSRCFVPSEPTGVGSVVGPRTTVSIKSSSRRSSFEGKPRSKHGVSKLGSRD